MRPVFQEILENTMVALKEALEQESGEWDADDWELEVRQFTRQMGQSSLQVWAEVKAKQAQEQARFCFCGQRRHLHKLKPLWWLSSFGRVELEVPRLRCPQGHGWDQPFQRLTGLESRGKSIPLQRAMTDFGAEKSFAQASQQLWEHYGVELGPSSVRQVVREQAERAEALTQDDQQEAIQRYGAQQHRPEGKPWLVIESDGSMVRTGALEPDPEGGVSPQEHRPKRRRQTQWREVRLSVVQTPGEEERQYAAVLGSPPEGRRANAGAGPGNGLWREHPGARCGRRRPLDRPADS